MSNRNSYFQLIEDENQFRDNPKSPRTTHVKVSDFMSEFLNTSSLPFNIKDYGAIGNGVADDTAAIQAAIDAAALVKGRVYAPASVYLTGQIVIKNGVWLYGDGKFSTIFKLKSGTNTHAFKNYKASGSEANAENWAITDCMIDGNKTVQSAGDGIYVEVSARTASDTFNDSRWLIKNVFIFNTKDHGVETIPPRTSGGRIVNVDVFFCDGNGFRLTGADTKILGCETGSTGLAGFYLNSSSCQIDACKSYFSGRITAASGYGFQLNASFGCTISNSVAQDNSASGFRLENFSGRVIVSGCVSDSNSTAGVGTYAGVDVADTNWADINIVCVERRSDGSNSYQRNALLITGSTLNNKIKLTHSKIGSAVVDAPVHSSSTATAGNHITINAQDGTQSISYAASIVPDPYAGSTALIGSLTGAITVNATTQQHTGQSLNLIFTQDSTGGRTITFNSQYKTSWTPDLRPSMISVINFVYNGTNWIDTNYRSHPQNMLPALGLITEPYPRTLHAAGQILIDGTVYLSAVPLRAGDVITNLVVSVSTIGNTLTLSKLGIYDKLGNRLGLTAELGTLFSTSLGQKAAALTSPYTITTSDVYYLAVVSKGSVLPTLHRGSNNVNIAPAIGTGNILFGSVVSQTDLPSSLTLAVGASPINFWIGAY